MEIGYEKRLDDLAIILAKNYEYKESIEVDEGFIIDIDKKGKLVAIEIVGCAEQLGVSPNYVERAKIEAFVEPYEFSYKIIISFNDGEYELEKRVLK